VNTLSVPDNVSGFRKTAGSARVAAILRIVGVCAFLPYLAVAGTIGGRAYGILSGAAYNDAGVHHTNCSYNYSANTTGLIGSCGYTDTGTIDRNASDGSQWTGLLNSFTGSIDSHVDPDGSLHADLGMNFINYPVDPNTPCGQFSCSTASFADAYAYSQDTLSFSTSGPQIPFQVVTTVDFSGTISDNDALVTVSTLFGQYSVAGSYSNQINQSSGQMNAGDPYYSYLSLHLSAQLVCNSIGTGPDSGVHLCSAAAQVNFSNTEKFTAIAIEDMSGNLLSGYSVTSASGYDYNSLLATGAAPEPATLLLAGLGVLLCGAVSPRRWKKN
jgi:hypothetical protein